MRFIPTRVHGMLDYPMGFVLIALPWIGDFANGGAAQWVPIAVGVVMFVASLFTDYELGLVRTLPMSAHLSADAVMGVLLAVSPWLFGFSDVVWLPHLILGLGELGAALTTETHPRHSLAQTSY